MLLLLPPLDYNISDDRQGSDCWNGFTINLLTFDEEGGRHAELTLLLPVELEGAKSHWQSWFEKLINAQTLDGYFFSHAGFVAAMINHMLILLHSVLQKSKLILLKQQLFQNFPL